MKLNDYQKTALEFAVYPRKGRNLQYTTIGLCEEAGEAAGKVKKRERDAKGKFSERKRKEYIKELGDVLWYLAACAKEVHCTLEEVAELNISKLKGRHQRGTIHGAGDDR